MDTLTQLFVNFIDLSVDASPWLLLGLVIAGLMKAWVPTELMSQHLGQGKMAIVKAAFIGAPLPLCSCGVIPVATELRRSGASVPATSSFLVATPETGVDSVSVSYAMLGPVIAIYRPIVAILSAIVTGFLVSTSTSGDVSQPKSNQSSDKPHTHESPKAAMSCCANKPVQQQASILIKTLNGLRYAATRLIDDLIIWLLVGLVFAALVKTFIPTSLLLNYGSGLTAMLLMIVISIPMYICATASTPIAAGLILSGISPGTALVFMMAGPATNISTLGVIKNEMGTAVLWRYLLGVSSCAIAFGLLLDWSLAYFTIDFTEQMQHSHELLPVWLGVICAGIICFFAIKPLRNIVLYHPPSELRHEKNNLIK